MNSVNTQNIKTYFVSDLHLKSVNEKNAQLFLRFIKKLRNESKDHQVELFLLGDIFDLWLSDHQVFVDRYAPIINALRDLRARGIQIHYFEGNHDVHVDVFFQKELGIEVYTEATFFERSGLRLRIEHGDYINPEDRIYHKYLSIIRNPWVEEVGHRVPGFVWNALGQAASQLSRRKAWSKKSPPPKDRLRALLLDYTKRVFAEKPFDVLITGHIHLREDAAVEVNGQKARTINLGSWFDQPMALLIEDEKISWIEIEEKQRGLSIN